jgi:hypothetical protein
MRPLTCLTITYNNTDDLIIQVCLAQFGSTYAVPSFSHMGGDLTTPTQCNCTDGRDYSNVKDPCNVFRFYSGCKYKCVYMSVYKCV